MTGNVTWPMEAAPARPARPPIVARLQATAALVLCFSAIGAFASFSWSHRIDRGSVSSEPVRIPATAWRSILMVAATADRRCPPSVPVAVLYVSKSCAHCRAELNRWASLVRDSSTAIACVGIAVAVAPGKSRPPEDWMPAELAPMLLWDHDGAIARALDVRLVPLASYISNRGTEVARAVGEVSESSTLEHLAVLRRISGGAGAR